MEIRRLGSHGLAVSALGLGTLTWGRDTDQVEAAQMLASYRDAGGTTLDVPSDWSSTFFSGRVQAVGQTIADIDRDELVVILHSGLLDEPAALSPSTINRFGPPTSKRNLIASLDAALRDLATDHVDLWVIHGPRLGISLDEIREATRYALSSGRTAYAGLSGFDEWDLGALTAPPAGSEPRFAALADPLSLLDSSAERMMSLYGVEQGLGFVALAPLAQGVLTGKYRHSTPPDSRAATGHLASFVQRYLGEEHFRVVEATVRAAAGLDVSPMQVALAWVLAQPVVSTAVIGPRNSRQLDAILDEPPLKLQRELREVLSEVAIL